MRHWQALEELDELSLLSEGPLPPNQFEMSLKVAALIKDALLSLAISQLLLRDLCFLLFMMKPSLIPEPTPGIEYQFLDSFCDISRTQSSMTYISLWERMLTMSASRC